MAVDAGKISDAELAVMKVVWGKAPPVTYAEIRAVLGGEDGWDTSTIRTLIRRLVEKEVLLQQKEAVYHYTPAITEGEFLKARTREFLHKVYSGDARQLVATMLGPDVLPPDELAELEAFWRKGRGDG